MSKPESINHKITTLNEKIAWFYSDDFSLDSALSNYKDSIALANEIKQDLSTLKNEIEVLSKDFQSDTSSK